MKKKDILNSINRLTGLAESLQKHYSNLTFERGYCASIHMSAKEAETYAIDLKRAIKHMKRAIT